MPVYAHWLALEMLRVYESAKEKLANNTELKFDIDDQKFVVDKSRLTEASESIDTACKLESRESVVSKEGVLADANLFSSELAFSAILAVHLDRYLFSGKDSKVGFCVHQGPTRKRMKLQGTPEAADLYVCGNKDRCYGTPVALGDVKLNKMQEAVFETALYCCTSCSVQSYASRKSPVYIGLPCTVSRLTLYLYIESEYSSIRGSRMWAIPIAKDLPYSQAMLCAIYCGVHFMLRESFYLPQPIQTLIPLSNKPNLKPLVKGDKPRVFLDEDSQLVYKYFTDSIELPNADLLESVGGFEEVEVEKVAETLSILRYKYMHGNHEAQEVGQFHGVIQTLDKLHKRGYVHGDVRAQNIVFTGNNSILIDFDLVATVGTVYPDGYNGYSEKFPERHREAGPGWKMMMSHDIHSLLYLMCKYSTGELKSCFKGMMTSLHQIAEKKTRRAAENEESEEVKMTLLATLERRLARSLQEILEKLGRAGSEHMKTRPGKKKKAPQ